MTEDCTFEVLKREVGRATIELDAAIPGWRDKIDLKRLNMDRGWHSIQPGSLTCGCVLAQLDPSLSLEVDGYWGQTMDASGLSETEAFCNKRDSPKWFDMVTDLWTREINQRGGQVA